MKTALDPSVRTLGIVSLLNDAGSEMVYPLLPAFLLGTLGASPAALGMIEGTAEAVASLVKLVSGSISDRATRRKPFIFVGYALSACARPLIAAARTSFTVLVIRLVDRCGKGIRSAPRDALVAQVTDPASRGRAFGFQRAMDNVGAVVGPLLAAGAMALVSSLPRVFLLATIPGVLASLAVLLGVKDRPVVPPSSSAPSAEPGGSLPRGLPSYLVVLALFTLGNSSDTFLLLRAQESGVSIGLIPILWALHNLVKAGLSTPLGSLSDRIGRKLSITIGWGMYALTYLGFAMTGLPMAVLFSVYALHYAFTEGPERALVADFAAGVRGGRAFGLYHAVTGAMLLPASLLTGALWKAFGAETALLTGAALAAVATVGLVVLVPRPTGE
jgi:MFS family permease